MRKIKKGKHINIIVGKSGSGKNYVCEASGLVGIPSYTTRQKRFGEEHGVEHLFVKVKSRKAFLKRLDKINKAAYTVFNKHHYWATFEQFEDKKYTAYIVDTKGLDDILKYSANKQIKRQIKIYFIDAPWDYRFKRMLERGDSLIDTISRLTHDMHAFNNFEEITDKYKMKYTIIDNR